MSIMQETFDNSCEDVSSLQEDNKSDFGDNSQNLEVMKDDNCTESRSDTFNNIATPPVSRSLPTILANYGIK